MWGRKEFSNLKLNNSAYRRLVTTLTSETLHHYTSKHFTKTVRKYVHSFHLSLVDLEQVEFDAVFSRLERSAQPHHKLENNKAIQFPGQ